MTDIMRTGRMLAEAVREKTRLERELSIVTARINTLSAEITQDSASIMPRDMGDCPPGCTETSRHAEVRETAERQIAEFTEIRDRP